MWQRQVEWRYKLPGKLSSKLALVERSNPTYNSVRLQEGKLRVAGTQIHVHIWPRAPASVDYTDSSLCSRRRKNRTLPSTHRRLIQGSIHACIREKKASDLINANLDARCNCADGCDRKQWRCSLSLSHLEGDTSSLRDADITRYAFGIWASWKN